MVLAYQMFFLLSKVSKVSSWWTCVYLSRWNSCTCWDISSSSYNCKALDCRSTANGCSHADISETFEVTGVKGSIGSDVYVVSDVDSISVFIFTASNMWIILYKTISTYINLSLISSKSNSMPDRATFFGCYITYKHGIWSNPIRENCSWIFWIWNWYTS